MTTQETAMHVLIVEDEEIVARRLMRLVGRIVGNQIESIEVIPSLHDAMLHVRRHPIDLLFLDLNLSGRDGFQLLTEAVAGAFQTIVVSANIDQAIRAFELGVTDFVPKPYSEERLRQAIDRIVRREKNLGDQLRFLAVRKTGEIQPIPIDTIIEIRGAGDYSEIVTEDGSTHLHDKTLETLDHLLPMKFARVHRSHIINLDFLERIESKPGSRYVAVMKEGSRIPVSRQKISALRSRMG